MLNKALAELRSGVELQFSRREVIFNDNSSASHLYLILRGRVKLISNDESGKEFIHEIRSDGDLIGNFSLDEGAFHTYHAIALSESTLLRVSAAELRELLTSRADLLSVYLNRLQQTLNYSRFLNHELAQHNPEHNIIGLLEYFMLTDQHLAPGTGKLDLTRQQIANMLGLRVETVIRVIKSLEEKKLLRIKGGKVYLSRYVDTETA